jgi:hypothetical protein
MLTPIGTLMRFEAGTRAVEVGVAGEVVVGEEGKAGLGEQVEAAGIVPAARVGGRGRLDIGRGRFLGRRGYRDRQRNPRRQHDESRTNPRTSVP